MRLTLRTLLAYLDDTLGPNEIKSIGEKVAESDAAQELIARIKQVTRRRRLTTPPTSGPAALDPNDVAEYLDNELDSERVADIEKLCLESDVHLAEIAACHQILTLVLGEPALVPPKAKERMYKLVRSRESFRNRKAAPVKKTLNVDGLDDEEELALGGSWLRWVVPVAGLLLLSALGVALWSLAGKPGKPIVASKPADQDQGKPEPPNNDSNPKPPGPPPSPPKDNDQPKPPDQEQPKPPPTPVDPPKTPQPQEPRGRNAPPSTAVRELATFRGPLGEMACVLARSTVEGWASLPRNEVVRSTDTLTALPGCSAILIGHSGVNLALRGHLPAFSFPQSPLMNLLLESTVTLHAPPPNLDLDLTLQRGRIYLRNAKESGPCKIRLRLDNEVWDIRLALPSDEVGVDLVRLYTPDTDPYTEPPRTMVVFFVMRGEVQMDLDEFHSHRLEADGNQTMLLMWDSQRKSFPPQRTTLLKEFAKMPPTPEEVEGTKKSEVRDTVAGLKNLQTLIEAKPRDKLTVALKEGLDKDSVAARIAAIFALATVDEPGRLLEVLANEQRTHAPDRLAAIFALRHWLSAEQNRYKKLYDKTNSTGLLVERGYKDSEAKTLVELLFDLSPEYWNKPETFYSLARCLEHRRIAIAELGYWHLSRLAMDTRLPDGFNAAFPAESREQYAKRIIEMIDKRLLPPAPPLSKEPRPSEPSPRP
ncbi:MAG: hypothetical protein SNJ75_09945 [Gemmataceae bacterium]